MVKFSGEHQMRYCTLTMAALFVPICTFAEECSVELPKPDYARDASDPDWLSYAAQFHGHLGPWATAGLRLGAAGRQVVDAEGYFDVQVVATGPFAKPPRSCFLDGLQIATGATWGKRNIEWTDGDDVSVRVTNTKTGKIAVLKPTKKLLELLASFKPKPKVAADDDDNHAVLEGIARKIARLPGSELLTIQIRE
jgi:formylmethanofuran dehydrogenase subunit E